MLRVIINRISSRSTAPAVHAYRASTDTPRNSVVGFTLLLCLGIQIVSGFFVTSRIFESAEVQNFTGLLHRTIPLFFVGFLCLHILRAFISSATDAFAAFKSGGIVLFYISVALGTGYVLAASGEAGYWGAVISIFNVVWLVADFLFKAVLSLCILIGISLGFDTDSLFAVLTGSTTISPSVFFSFIFFIHLVAGVVLFWVASAHMGVTHAGGTVFGVASRSGSNSTLFSVVESRDLRLAGVAMLILVSAVASMSWLFRCGNGILLNTEIKPPARVATEAYFAGIYAGFRYLPLMTFVGILVAGVAICWFLASRQFIQKSKFVILAILAVFTVVFAAVGFIPADLIEHAVVSVRAICLPCLLDTVSADMCPFYILKERDLEGPCGEILRQGRRSYLIRTVSSPYDIIYGQQPHWSGGKTVVYIIPNPREVSIGLGEQANSSICRAVEGELLRGELYMERLSYGATFDNWWKAQLAMDTHRLNPHQLHLRIHQWHLLVEQGLIGELN